MGCSVKLSARAGKKASQAAALDRSTGVLRTRGRGAGHTVTQHGRAARRGGRGGAGQTALS